MFRYTFFTILYTIGLVLHAQKFEAETGTLTGTSIANSRAGYSGDGYVTGFDNDGDAVSISVSVDAAGLFDLWVGFAAPNGEKTNDIYVNGGYVGSQIFPSSQTFQEGYFGKIMLEEGVNKVKIVKNWGYFDVDFVRVSPTTPNEIHNYSTELVTENSSFETETLFLFLRDYYGHRIISGQQASDGGDLELDYIGDRTGYLPAIKGFDLIDYSPSRVANGTSSEQTDLAIEWWQEDKGIVSLMWHWNAPKDLLNTDDAPWWSGFYSYATTFDPTIAMNDQNSEEYELLIRDIDVIAAELKKLQDAKVPVLWRPLHEAEGTWFWWGSKGPEVCVWLWKLMYDRLTEEHGLNNLIWVWTGTNSEHALDWYPGDQFVDIIGADIYLENGNYATNFSMFDDMAGIHEGKKVITLSETGTIPDPSALDDQKARWSWFVVWSGDFIMDGQKNEVNHVVEVYQHDYVLTLDELPDFYNYESPDFPDETILTLPEQMSVRIFPNPTSDYLYLESSSLPISRLKVYDLNGNEMRVTTAGVGTRQTLDLRKMNRGIYLVRLWTARGIKGYKILVE
ncbi:MAG: beta-mannanase [Flammeovirgaceae bacterium]|nr:beta-mannanase [Flammeovirgaceae bacterium]MBE61000.1 beta-mannanase [Flammeovirgaceae bacterium]HCX20656.1 beta-mannanase [Cytophagales bacterium]